MSGETITIVCTAHRRRVKPGPGDAILHVGGNVVPRCSSQRFTIRREQVTDRGTAGAMLAGLETAENSSVPAGATGEDEGS